MLRARRRPFLLGNLSASRPLFSTAAANFFFVFVYILFTDSFWTYTWENRIPFTIVNVAVVLAGVMCFIVLIMNLSHINLGKLKAVFAIYIGICVNMFVNLEISFGYIQKLAYPLIGVVLCMMLDFNKVAKAFVRVMAFLSVWSLVLYFMAQFKLEEVLPVIKNISGIKFHNGLLGLILVDGDRLVRNWGIFWEPGAFQSYLCMALLLDLFFLKDRKPYFMILFAITILSTLSTTGIICLALILFLYIITMHGRKFSFNRKIILATILLGILIFLLSEKLQSMVFDKLKFSNIQDSASFGARYYSIIGNLKIMFSDGLLVGTGVSDYNEIYRQTVLGMGYARDMSNTNTIFVDFARFGWLVGFANIYLIYKFAKKIGNGALQKLGIAAIIMIVLFMESFTYSLFWMSFMYFGIGVYRGRRSNENPVSVQ